MKLMIFALSFIVGVESYAVPAGGICGSSSATNAACDQGLSCGLSGDNCSGEPCNGSNGCSSVFASCATCGISPRPGDNRPRKLPPFGTKPVVSGKVINVNKK